MANSVTITAETADGKSLDALAELIAKREKWLGETTSEAVIATSINILSSLRALTKVCDPKKAAGFVNVAPYPALVPSFRRAGAKRFLCLRPPGKKQPHVSVAMINAAGKPHKGWLETVKVFVAQDRRSGDLKGSSKRYYIIARNLDEAKAFAASRRIKRIERFAGMAKWTIGQAQKKVADFVIDSMVANDINAYAPSSWSQKVGLNNLSVIVNNSGFSSGFISVLVADNLRYAQLALKGGPGDFDLALQKAANRTAGILNHSVEAKIFDFAPIPTPFPEVKGRK